MRTLNSKNCQNVLLVSLLLIMTGCAAKYHTVRKGQGGENNNSQEGDAVPGAMAPSAQVEVVFAGDIVLKVKAGSRFTIRPSVLTQDPDDSYRKDCRNPGIIKAVYTPGTEPEKTSSRSDESCDPLEVEHSFTVPGFYEIGMTVTSNEMETAQAKMTLEVIASDAPETNTDGGFVVSADPLIAEVGQNIKFSGDCSKAIQISWDYRDQTTGAGAETLKAYNTPGQYVVLANCETQENRILKGQVTVVIVPKKTSTPVSPDQPGQDPGPGDNTDTGTTTPTAEKPGDGSTPPQTATPPAATPPATDDGPNVPPVKNPGTDNDDDKPVNHPGKPGQNPGQSPGQHS